MLQIPIRTQFDYTEEKKNLDSLRQMPTVSHSYRSLLKLPAQMIRPFFLHCTLANYGILQQMSKVSSIVAAVSGRCLQSPVDAGSLRCCRSLLKLPGQMMRHFNLHYTLANSGILQQMLIVSGKCRHYPSRCRKPVNLHSTPANYDIFCKCRQMLTFSGKY